MGKGWRVLLEEDIVLCYKLYKVTSNPLTIKSILLFDFKLISLLAKAQSDSELD